MRAKWLDRSLVLNPYYYTVCTSEALFHRELRHLKIAKPWPEFVSFAYSQATCRRFEHSARGRAAIVCMPVKRRRNPSSTVGILIHEAVHIWQWARDYIGEQAPSSEFEAYAVEQISTELIREYFRQTARKKG